MLTSAQQSVVTGSYLNLDAIQTQLQHQTGNPESVMIVYGMAMIMQSCDVMMCE